MLTFHVAVSLVGIGVGLIVLYGMLRGQQMDAMTALFLVTTVLTSATGFLLPFEKVLPSHILAIISLVLLAVSIFARYPRKLGGRWRKTYVITAVVALYLNVLVLVVQSFLKVTFLHALAPEGKELPFVITQLVVLTVFAILGTLAAMRFKEQPALVA